MIVDGDQKVMARSKSNGELQQLTRTLATNSLATYRALVAEFCSARSV